MKVFISWSGKRSRAVAETLRKFVPRVLQFAVPYMSSKDLSKGVRWFEDVEAELGTSDFGIVCLTQSNLSAPWINFEAGAIANSLRKPRVSALLIDLPFTALSGPLTQFQHTLPTKEDILALLASINESAEPEKRLEDAILTDSFLTWWTKYEAEFERAVGTEESAPAVAVDRTQEELISELVELTRANSNSIGMIEQTIAIGNTGSGYGEISPLHGMQLVLSSLHPRDAEILRLHLGLGRANRLSNVEIGERFGLTDAQVQSRIDRSLKKINSGDV